MTKSELDRFRAILTNWNASPASARGSRLREAPISWRRSRRLPNVHSRFVISRVNSTNFETLVRRSVVSRKATSGRASSAMRRST